MIKLQAVVDVRVRLLLKHMESHLFKSLGGSFLWLLACAVLHEATVGGTSLLSRQQRAAPGHQGYGVARDHKLQ